jgi:hypothetical protein
MQKNLMPEHAGEEETSFKAQCQMKWTHCHPAPSRVGTFVGRRWEIESDMAMAEGSAKGEETRKRKEASSK